MVTKICGYAFILISAICLLHLLASGLAFAQSQSAAVIDTTVLKQIRNQAVEDWQKIDSKLQSFDVTYESTAKDERSPKYTKPLQQYRLAFDAKRSVSLLRTVNVEYPNQLLHQVANQKYQFKVHCPDENEQGALLKLTVIDDVSNDPSYENGLPVWSSARCRIYSASHLSCMTLEEFVLSDEFTPLEAIEVTKDDRSIIRYSAKYNGENGWVRRKGGVYTIELEPAQHHRLLNWTINTPNAQNETYTVTYQEGDQWYAPSVIVYDVNYSGKVSHQQWDYGELQPFTLSDEEFHLPHYGFSEKVLDTLTPNPWPRWLLVIGGITSIIIGAWLIRRRERAQVA